jgi:hypothetical protein
MRRRRTASFRFLTFLTARSFVFYNIVVSFRNFSLVVCCFSSNFVKRSLTVEVAQADPRGVLPLWSSTNSPEFPCPQAAMPPAAQRPES